MTAFPTVVLCDDHLLFAEALGAVLARQGFQVRAVVTYVDELVAEVTRSTPDLCVLDLHFPGQSIDGVEAAAEVRRASPGTYVLMLSGQLDATACARAIAAGVTGFLGKATEAPVLFDTALRVASGEVVVDPALLRAAVGTAEGTRRRADNLGRFLTARELAVLQLLTAGATTEAVGRSLGVARSTARTHIQNVLGKLGVHSRLEAAAYAMRYDLVECTTENSHAVS